jgi:hypothetical protein
MGPVVAGMEADRRGGGGWYGAFGRYGGMRGGEGVCWTFSLSGKGRTRTRTSWTGRGGLMGQRVTSPIVTIGSYLSADLRADARKSEAEGLYLGPRPVPAASRSRRSRPRAERRTRRGERNPTAHSGEREREARGGLPARLRDPQHRIWDADTQIEQYGRSSVQRST